MSDKVTALMALVRSIVFDKPDGGKRPVAIGEGWYRFIWKCVMKVVGRTAAGQEANASSASGRRTRWM
jgi:hypothetical protein